MIDVPFMVAAGVIAGKDVNRTPIMEAVITAAFFGDQ